MIDIVSVPLGTLDCGDDAEDAVVSAIQKTGKVLLERWAEKKSDEMTEETAMESGNHLHGKKSCMANLFRSYQNSSTVFSKEEISFFAW